MAWPSWLKLSNGTQPQPESVPVQTSAPTDPPELQRRSAILEELGISGTVNYDGRIQNDPNPQLRDHNARGRPGVGYSWGEWERIANTDPAVTSALNLVAAPLRDATLEVEPGEEGAEFELHAEFVRDNLLKWLDPQWSMLIEEIATSALTQGFDIHEPVMSTRPDERVPGGVAVFMAKLAHRLPSSLAQNPWKEENGELACVIQQGLKNGKYETDIRLPADRILLTSWGRKGNNYEGVSALRSVWYLAKMREAMLKIFAIGTEREALGIPVASVDKDAKLTEAQISKWQAFLENLTAHEHAAAFPPPGVSLDWKFSPVSNKGHVLDAWERLGKAIHQVFLTQQVMLGVDGTGSRAVGEVHDATKNDFIGGVKAVLEATFNGVGQRPYTGLASRIVIPNFGPQKAYPRIKLVMKRREVTAGELSQQVPALITAGALTWRIDDENALRDKYGLAPVTPEEWGGERERRAAIRPEAEPIDGDVDPRDAAPATAKGVAAGAVENVQQTALNGAQVQAAQAIVQAVAEGMLPRDAALGMLEIFFQISREAAEKILGTVGAGFVPTPTVEPAQEPAEGEDSKGPDEKKQKFSESRRMPGPWQPRRALFAWEQHVALADIDDFFNRERDRFEERVRGHLTAAVAKALPEIRDAMADGDPSEIANLPLDFTDLEKFVEAFLERQRAEGYAQVAREARRQPEAIIEKRQDGEAALAAKGGSVRLAEGDEEGGEGEEQDPTSARRNAMGMLARLRDRLLRRLRARVIDNIEVEALNALQTGGDPAAIVNKVVNRTLDTRGLKFDGGSVQARAFSAGREEFAQEHGDRVEAMAYSAILDSNTCGECNAQDGKRFEFNSPEHLAHVPPYSECKGGELCRCLLIVIWKQEGFRKVEEAPEA